VFPVPAPARIKTGPFTVSTACLCCGFNELRLTSTAEFKSQPVEGKRYEKSLLKAIKPQDFFCQPAKNQPLFPPSDCTAQTRPRHDFLRKPSYLEDPGRYRHSRC